MCLYAMLNNAFGHTLLFCKLRKDVNGMRIFEEIISRDNKKTKEFVKLFDNKGYRDSTNLFVIESEKLIFESLKCGIELEVVFVSRAYFDRNEQSIEKQFQEVDVYIISEEVEKKLVKTVSPQGIYAICKKKDQILDIAQVSKSGTYVFLCDIQDAGNMGTIIRTAEALGLDGVILSKSCCDIYNPKVLRATMGCGFRTKFLKVNDITQTLIELSNSGCQTVASVVNEDAQDVLEFKKDQFTSTVLLIGNEGNGLQEEHIQLSKNRVKIKMKGNAESLNAAMACCILMWEISK